MNKNNLFLLFIFGSLVLLTGAGLISGYVISNYDYSSSSILTGTAYSTGLSSEDCSGGSDFLVQIDSTKCEPLLVTSDLLEEEPVTVYCPIVATQINPFIDVNAISYINIVGKYSSDVQTIGYFPSESALGYWYDGTLDNLALNDLGYVAITLRKNANESSMPDFVKGTLTAKLTYDIEDSFGIGASQFYLPVLSDEKYKESAEQYSFWDGRGYARATSVDGDSATIVLYTSSLNQKMASVTLTEGKTSGEFYIPDLNSCLATFKVKLNSLENPDTRVKLKVGSDYVEVTDEESFLDGACKVKSITKNGINQEVSIYCKGDEKSETFKLKLSPKVNLEINGIEEQYSVGDYLYTYTDSAGDQLQVYLGYVGSKGDSTDKENLFVVLVTKASFTKTATLTSSEISSIAAQMNLLFNEVDSGANVVTFLGDVGSKLIGSVITAGKWVMSGQSYAVLDYGTSASQTEFEGKTVSLKGFAIAEDSDLIAIKEKDYFLIPSSSTSYDYLDKYKVIEDSGADVRLTLSYSVSGTPKISLKNSTGEIVANFYGNNCETHKDCKVYSLSSTGLSFKKGDYNGFFDNVLSANISIEDKKIILTYISSEEKDNTYSKYYVNAISDFETLINSYSSQTTDVNSETFGERGLYDAIKLSYSLGQMKTMSEFCNEFKGSYPNSVKDVSVCDSEYKSANSALATYEILIDKKIKTISLESIYEPGYSDYGAKVVVKGMNGKSVTYELSKGKKVYLYGLRDDVTSTNTEYIELVSVDDASASIKVNAIKSSSTSKLFETNTKTLKEGESDNFGSEYVFTLSGVNLEQSAKVTITPSFNYQGSNSTFNFSIGIEKRTILLTDSMIKNRIKALNNSMNTLNDIVDGLDTFNRALGYACIGTEAWLTVKNLVKNSDGSAIAREEVMNGNGGWTERCNKYIASGTYSSASTEKYSSLEDCYYENADAIDAQVETVQNTIEEQNTQIKSIQETYSANDIVNKTAVLKKYSVSVSSSLESVGNTLTDSTGKQTAININDIQALLSSSTAQASGIYDSSDLKEIQLYAELYSGATNSADKAAYQDSLYSALTDLVANTKAFSAAEELKTESGLASSIAVMTLDKTKKTTEIAITAYETFGASSYNSYTFASGSKVIASTEYIYAIRDSTTGNRYLVVYDKDGIVSATYQIDITAKTLTIYGTDAKTGKILTNPFDLLFKKYSATDYQNKYTNAELKYYETGVYKEYPALVPFDSTNGWYAGIKNSDSGTAAYDSSGKVRNMWLCNVGKNGLEQFSFSSNSYGDDICQEYDLTHTTVTFSGLTLDKTAVLLTKAQKSIEAAQKAYKNGVSSVTLDGVKYKVGQPATSTSEIQCENYMSPKDCKLLFNVCDPVVCPSSRCNFGGNYPVSDVVQTGVIGSIALCAPNYKEGIYLPICTTGVQAGLESWVNIEESYRDCLQDYLNNGEVTGTCDKIHSIYTCEFFWKESIPLLKIGIAKATSTLSGEGVHGGSEYLTFASAWQSARDSVDYFTSYYAAESYSAFKTRSVEDAGTDVCKVSMSVVYSSGADLLKSLTTPRSPSQYTGSFEETTLTTATNPPTSHYKVYYYIYAGEDTGATFQIYLKGSSSSYYQDSTSTHLVDSGYISSGGYATETVDFSAPSGFTNLCISVNGDVECGFGKVSTSFIENYLNDLYLEEQSTTEVTTEDDCTSGTASFYSLINPNLQDILEDVADTDLYSDGITRVCATANPGTTTDANYNTEDARWRDVGYCGEKTVRCWIDTDTVKAAIKTLNIEEAALNDTAESYLESLLESGQYINTASYTSKVSLIKNETNMLTRISLINEIINKVFYSNQKANLFLLRGEAYSSLALSAYADVVKAIEAQKLAEEETANETTSGATEEELALAEFNAKYISPVFEFEDGKLSSNFCYRYYNSVWQWSASCGNNAKWNDAKTIADINKDVTNNVINNPSDANKEFIASLYVQNGNYFEGLRLLMDRTVTNDEGGITDADLSETAGITTMDNEMIFTVEFADVNYKSMQKLYFKFADEGWVWDNAYESGEVWISVSNPDSAFNAKQKEIANLLGEKGATLYKGSALLYDYSSEDIIEYLGGGIAEEVSFEDSLERRDTAKLISLMKSLSTTGVLTTNFNCYCGNNCADYATWINEATEKQSIPDELLLLAIMIQESSCKSVKSSGGDLGLMQINPDVHCGEESLDLGLPIDTEDCESTLLINNKTNINVGAQILKKAYRTSSKSFICGAIAENYIGWEAALRGYNGWGCTGNNNYVEDVEVKYLELVNLYNGVSSSTTANETITNETTSIPEEDIFVIEPNLFQKIAGVKSVYYKYSSGWKWTFYSDYSLWMNVDKTTVTSGEYKGDSPNAKNLKIIESLKSANYSAGKKILSKNDGTMVDGSFIDTSEDICDNSTIGKTIVSVASSKIGQDTTRVESGNIVYDHVCATFVSNVLIESNVLPQFSSCSTESIPYRDAIVELVSLFKTNGYEEISKSEWSSGLKAGDILIWGGTGEYDSEYQHITIFSAYSGETGAKIIDDGGAGQKIAEKTYSNIHGASWYVTHVWRVVCP